jgi:shikimate kinase
LNFILIGIPNSGKTTLGKKAADAMGMNFYDTDISASDHICGENKTPSFSQFTNAFPGAEETVVQQIAKTAENAIIATGAETALSARNVQALRQAGRFIYLKRDPDRMIREIREKHPPRPEEPNVHDMNELVVFVYKEMIPEYEKLADFTVENDQGLDAGLEQLIKIIRAELDAGCNHDPQRRD